MKRITYFVLLITIIAISCKKNDTITTGIQPVNLTINLTYGLENSGYKLPLDSVIVRITNKGTGSIQSSKVDGTGVAKFLEIPAGVYDIDATVTFADTVYNKIANAAISDNITFNASEKNSQVTVGNDVSLSMTLVAGTVGKWVIKQIYYAGSHRTEGAIFRDQFIELYNNSDEVLYADSLCIGQVFGRQSTTGSTYYIQASGQLDWSRSLNMPSNIDANNDYVYTRSLNMIPGTGRTYPVNPGQSLLIAQTAINHKVPFVGQKGDSVTVKNPSLTVDLSGADFEAYYGALTNYNSDVDNVSVPNLEIIQYYGSDYILDNLGRDAYVIFKPQGTVQPINYPQYNLPTVSAPSSSAKKYFQIPVEYIIDGVEVQPATSDDHIPKKLKASIDAGYTFVPLGGYSSQSVIRKTLKTVNGRIILKDTNNSNEDFTYFDMATPRGFK